MRARAHWPNVAQIDLTVVVVIVGVVVVVVVDELWSFWQFSILSTDRQTNRWNDSVVYRVAPQLKIRV